MTTRFCLIGAGRIGRIHAGNIAVHPDAELSYIVDVDAAAAAAVGALTGAEVVEIGTALRDPALDAVVIATSTDTHLALIERCAAAGKAILCEKPLDLDAGNARKCVAVAAAAGVFLCVGFNRRLDPSFRNLRDRVTAGDIGGVEVVTIISRDPSPPPIDYVKRSGGLFRDMMIHDFDMARWLLGENPVAVMARGSCLIDPEVGRNGDIDTAAVLLETAGGRLCQITNSRRCSYGYDQRIEVFGEKGRLRAGNRSATSVETGTAAGFTREPALPFFLERYERAYQLEIDEFLRGLRNEPNQLASAEDGLKALLLADAAQASLESGKRVQVRT